MLYEYENWEDAEAAFNGVEYPPQNLQEPNIKPVQVMEGVWIPQCLAS